MSVCFIIADVPSALFTLPLHDALPICWRRSPARGVHGERGVDCRGGPGGVSAAIDAALTVDSRSEEQTSELQSQANVVCRLLRAKKNSDVVGDCRIWAVDEEFFVARDI